MAKKKSKTSKKINLDEIVSVSDTDKEGKIDIKVKKKEVKPIKEEFDWDNHQIKKNNDNFFGLL
tara:strand:- start:1644 stop:1835 length:192 start_codon:yes stop_codon:yes gene_type:complete